MKFYVRFLSAILSMVLLSGVFSVSFAEEKEYTILPTYIEIEIETGTTDKPGFQIISDAERLSGGKGMKCINSILTSVITLPSFTLPRHGFYDIWLRAGTESYSDEFYYSLDGGVTFSRMTIPQKSYGWISLRRKAFDGGEITIALKNKEVGVILDKLILTTSSTFVPEGLTGGVPRDIFDEEYVSEVPETEYPLPAEHPRVLVRKDDIPKIRERLTHPEHIGYYEKMLALAEEERDCSLPEIAEGKYNNASEDNLTYISANALHYLLFGEEKSARHAIDGIIEYLDTLKYDGANLGSIWSVEQNTAIFWCSLVYDWCYPQLTGEEKELLIRLCVSHASTSEIEWLPTVEKAYGLGHSTEQSLMRDFLAFSIAVYDEYPEAYNYVSGRIFNEYIPAFNFMYANGSQPVVGNYYGTLLRFRWELYMKWLLEAIGYGGLIDEGQEQFAYSMLIQRRPDGVFLKDGDDNSYRGLYYTAAEPAFLAGNLYKNPYLRQEMYRSSDKGVNPRYDNIFPLFLILNDPGVGLKNHTISFPYTHFTGRQTGMMIARTGWNEGRNSPDMLVSMKINEKYFDSHGHLDTGEFEIFYKGNQALDSGVYEWFGNEHDFGYNKQTIAHNCMLIDDGVDRQFYEGKPSLGGQFPAYKIPLETFEDFAGENTDHATISGYDFGNDMHSPEYTYLKGDLTAAYGGSAKEYTRTFMFNNLYDEKHPGVLIVLDKVTGATEETKKTWLLHTQNQPTVYSSLIRSYHTDGGGQRGNLAVHPLVPEKANRTVTVVGGAGNEFLVGDTNYPTAAIDSEAGKYRLEITHTEGAETEYFLNVLQAYPSNTSYVNPKLLENDTHYGVQIKDRVIWLSKNNERLENTVTVSSGTAVGEKLVQVDSLKGGTWHVSGNDADFNINVPENAGVAAFKATSGDYTLTRISEAYTLKDYSLEGNIKEPEAELIPVMTDKIMDSKIRAYNFDGVPYVEVNEYAETVGADVTYDGDKFRLSQYDWYLEYERDCYTVYRNSRYNKGIRYLPVPVKTVNGKDFIPLLSTGKIVQKSITYTPHMNMIGITSLTPPDSNPGDNILDSLSFTVEALANEGGSVSPEGKKHIVADLTGEYTFYPEEGYYLKEILFNGISIPVNTSGEFVMETPRIKKNSVVEGVFAPLPEEGALCELTEGNIFSDGEMLVVFSSLVNPLKLNVSEWGISLNGDKYPGKLPLTESGLFGIGIREYKSKYKGNIDIKSYMCMDNGEIRESGEITLREEQQ